MKDKLREIALAAPINKIFEVIEITEDKNNSYTIYVESLDGITIDDCTNLTKHILNNIPKEISIGLTVSSAGIDKPLRAPIQFLKNIEKKVEIKTKDGKKHIGILHKYNFKEITIIKKEKKKTCELTLKHDDILQVKVKIF
jgi:ribosome maturation factor RimP